MKNVQQITKSILELLEEVARYQDYKENFNATVHALFKDYQRGAFSYFQYKKELDKLLKGRTKVEVLNSYNSYIFSLLKKIESLNTQLFYQAYEEKKLVHERIASPREIVEIKPGIEEEILKTPKLKSKPKPVAKPGRRLKKDKARIIEEAELEAEAVEAAVEKRRKAQEAPAAIITAEIIEKAVKPSLFSRIMNKLKVALHLKSKAELKIEESIRAAAEKREKVSRARLEKQVKHVREPEVSGPGVPEPEELGTEPLELEKEEPVRVRAPAHLDVEKIAEGVSVKRRGALAEMLEEEKRDRFAVKKRKKGSLFERWFKKKDVFKEHVDVYVRKQPKKEGALFTVSRLFGIEFIRELIRRKHEAEGFQGDETRIAHSTLRIERMRRAEPEEMKSELKKITATVLAEEARRVKNIMAKRRGLKVYKPTFFGAVSNLLVKKVSIFLLESFPEFFKGLYQSLRFANIRILSNTYVNMMVFGSFVSFILGLLIFGAFFSIKGQQLQLVVVKAIIMGLFLGAISFSGFFSYPYSRAKSRARSINTNLPFAVNHMAAVASSGVPPTKMFKLLAESRQYGEFSIEIEKIVNYIEVFGYDFLTAIKSVAVTTPSLELKDFFEGIVSTTQAGGDLKAFLGQKAEEYLLTYKLERQKYTESISTYSDIYTGILIAAPLFFVATLSLVSLLGGQVGGFDVPVVLLFGTYVVIPGLNIFFLIFLEMTQPAI